MKKNYANTRGQTLTEYLILLFLIALASIAATQKLGDAIDGRLKQAQKKVAAIKYTDGD